MKPVITPNWPAPLHIKACTTLRHGGYSEAPYVSFNLAQHVGDESRHVQANRALLTTLLALPTEPTWLEQTHSTIVVSAESHNRGKEADASFACESKQICVVLTADCLPILLCDRKGTCVAAIHAGWRGLANGIIGKTLDTLQLAPDDTLVWLGPAIGPTVYELGNEVRQQFIARQAETEKAFLPSSNPDRWLGNLYELAKLDFEHVGVSAIYGGDHCTYSDKERFFSYRRDGNKTGRMASLIWIEG